MNTQVEVARPAATRIALAVTNDLSRAAKNRAARAIESVHLAYYEKGGIRELEAQLDEQRGAAARHIYGLAKFAAEQSKTKAAAVAMFVGMCAYAEAQYKEEHQVENLKDALPTWAVYKSTILAGVRDYQLDPAKFRSEGAFRIELQKRRLQARQRDSEDDDDSEDDEPRSQADIEEMLATTVTFDSIRTLLSQVIFECEVLRASKRREAEAILRETMDRLQPLVDQRKVQ